MTPPEKDEGSHKAATNGRLWHYVKPNANSETISHCIFVDTETDEIQLDRQYTGHKLRFGWAAACHRVANGHWARPTWKRFSDIEDFWLWAMSHCYRKKKTWMWCHNSSFDYPVLNAFAHLEAIGWTLESAIIDAPPTIVKYRSENRTLVLCDTLNIWRFSLRELGERIGLPKLERPGEWTGGPEDDTYCVRDVEIIRKSICDWTDFLRSNDMGGFCPTIAAQAMRSFRHRWLKDRILIDNNVLSLDLARKCYHGGRCEAAFIGELKQPVHSLDVNSMYPYVMSYGNMPLRLRGISRYVSVHSLERLVRDYCVCAHVRLETSEPAFAVVMEGKLKFPIGSFDAYLCTPEIQYALNIGAIREVHLCSTYDRSVPFREFALDLYDRKERAVRNGSEVESRHWKLLLNSFYGKWGQAGRVWRKTGTCDPKLFLRERTIDAQTRVQTVRRYFGGQIYERSDDREGRESHPAIAAHICAEARMILWTLIRKVPIKHYFYCDTDGLLVSDTGLNALAERMDDFTLGSLKRVATYDHVRIYGCKDLILDNKKTLKGIRPDAGYLNGESYIQIKWTSLRGLLTANSLSLPRTSRVVKFLQRTYDKGIVGADGFVTPLHLGGI